MKYNNAGRPSASIGSSTCRGSGWLSARGSVTAHGFWVCSCLVLWSRRLSPSFIFNCSLRVPSRDFFRRAIRKTSDSGGALECHFCHPMDELGDWPTDRGVASAAVEGILVGGHLLAQEAWPDSGPTLSNELIPAILSKWSVGSSVRCCLPILSTRKAT